MGAAEGCEKANVHKPTTYSLRNLACTPRLFATIQALQVLPINALIVLRLDLSAAMRHVVLVEAWIFSRSELRRSCICSGALSFSLLAANWQRRLCVFLSDEKIGRRAKHLLAEARFCLDHTSHSVAGGRGEKRHAVPAYRGFFCHTNGCFPARLCATREPSFVRWYSPGPLFTIKPRSTSDCMVLLALARIEPSFDSFKVPPKATRAAYAVAARQVPLSK